jgi:hypothetical protein
MEELRAQTQHQLAVHPYGFLGVTAQKIMNRLSGGFKHDGYAQR